jgi:hypothetical protein
MCACNEPVVPTLMTVSAPARTASVSMSSREGAPMPLAKEASATPLNWPVAAWNPRGSGCSRAFSHCRAMRETRSGSPGNSR